MTFLPFARMWERIERSRQDSDTALFHDLMSFSEMMLKFAVLGMAAAIQDDRDRSRRRVLHELVRANGIGQWSEILDQIVTGPPAQLLMAEAREEVRQLSEKTPSETWQFRAVSLLHSCLTRIETTEPALSQRAQFAKWIRDFPQLRNKTKGHGALPGRLLSELCGPLEESLHLISDNYSLFKRQWAFLHQNLSGKYRVTPIADGCIDFEYLKKTSDHHLPNGVYVFFAKPSHVELVESNVDAEDFYLPNGGFTGKHFEMLSYISGATLQLDASAYIGPTGVLPVSETQGLGQLDPQGECFGNIPPMRADYIDRRDLAGC